MVDDRSTITCHVHQKGDGNVRCTKLVHEPEVLYFLSQPKFQTLGQPGVINGIKPLPALGLRIMTLGKVVPKFEKAY